MARNKLTDLNNHLFAQLERLNDEDVPDEKMQLEISKAKAITNVAGAIVKSSKLQFEAMKIVAKGNIVMDEVPGVFALPKEGGAS